MPIGESLDVHCEEWRGVVYPRDKWVISGIPDLTRGEPGLGVPGVRESPACLHNCILPCVGHYCNRGLPPIRGMLMFPGEPRWK